MLIVSYVIVQRWLAFGPLLSASMYPPTLADVLHDKGHDVLAVAASDIPQEREIRDELQRPAAT